MVGGDHIVQDCQTIAPPGLIEPVKPSSPGLGKLQEKFPLMASVGDMPDVSRHVVSVFSLSPWFRVNNPLFDRKNGDIA